MKQIELPQWQTSWPLKLSGLTRISASNMGLDLDRHCPANLALAVRPGTTVLDPDRGKPPRKSPFEKFPLGLVRDSYLQVLKQNQDISDEEERNARAADAVHAQIERVSRGVEVPREMRTWLVRCTQNVLTVVDSVWTSQNHLDLKFEVLDELVAIDNDGALEWTIWGGTFATADGSVRLLQALVMNNATARALPRARIATTARVLADGLSTHRPSGWGAPYVPNPVQLGPANRVMIELIGVVDASYQLVLDEPADQAREGFSDEVLGKAALLVAGGKPRATRKCLTCQARSVCTEPLKKPGLLGIEGVSPYPRVVSPSALGDYQTCPHFSYLKDVLGLSAPYLGDSPAIRRGQLAHAWFAGAYQLGVQITAEALPDPHSGEVDEVAKSLDWSGSEYQDVYPWLIEHARAKPIDAGAPKLSEFELVVKDTDADLNLVTRPDLLYSINGRVNWREIKTMSSPEIKDQDDFFFDYPELLMAICLLADKALGDEATAALGASEPGLVELEMLWPGGSRLVSWAAHDEVIVAKARNSLAQLVDRWAFDTSWQPPTRRVGGVRWRASVNLPMRPPPKVRLSRLSTHKPARF